MCAIFGLGFFKGHQFVAGDEPMLRKALTSMLSIAENSGAHASGVSIMREKNVTVLKKPIRGSMLACDTQLYDMLDEDFEFGQTYNKVQSVIGHCRLPTQGSIKNNKNNHPIVVNHIIGVHNGTISNDHKLFESFKGQFTRIAKVDTEIIFQLIANFSNRTLANTVDAITKATPYIRGGYACAVQNAKRPYNLFLFRNYQPIRARYWHKAKLLAFATRDHYIEHAFKDVDSDKLGPDDFVHIDILQNSGMAFDLHRGVYAKFNIQTGATSYGMGY